MTSLIEFKNQAKKLHDFLAKKNHEIKYSSCLQAIAKINGYTNWNTMSGLFAKKADVISVNKRAKTWICDSCGELIQKIEDGWVEWIVSVSTKEAYGLRLVHHAGSGPNGRSCQYHGTSVYQEYGGIINDRELSAFLGDDGLMQLLAMVAEQQMPQGQVLEMIKRLHISGYEHARIHFQEAISQFVFSPNTAPGFYWQENIDSVLKWSSSTRQDL